MIRLLKRAEPSLVQPPEDQSGDYWLSMMMITDLREDFFLLVSGSVGSREQFLQSGEGGASFSYFLIRPRPSELLSVDFHLIREREINKNRPLIGSFTNRKHTELSETGAWCASPPWRSVCRGCRRSRRSAHIWGLAVSRSAPSLGSYRSPSE